MQTNCVRDIGSQPFQTFISEFQNQQLDLFSQPDKCNAIIGGDLFAFSGALSCDGAPVQEFTNELFCLPSTCTSDSTMISTIMGELGLFPDTDSCSFSTELTFDGIGEGNPALLQCYLDMGPEFDDTIESIINLTDQGIVQIGDFCEESGFDMFILDSTVTCNGVVEYNELNSPSCLPSSCTADETLLKELLVGEPTMITSDQCTYDFTFEHIGPGIEYDTDLLCLNAFYLTADPEPQELYIVAKENAKNAAEADGGSPDFSSLPALCAGIDGYDYVTYSATRTCNGELDPEIVLNEPACLPLLCRGADEAIGQILLNDLTDDEDEEFTCMLSDVNIVGFEPSTKTGKAGKKGKNTKAPKATKAPKSTKAPKAPKAPKNPKRRLTNIVNLTSYAQRQVKGRNAHFRFKFWESPK